METKILKTKLLLWGWGLISFLSGLLPLSTVFIKSSFLQTESYDYFRKIVPLVGLGTILLLFFSPWRRYFRRIHSFADYLVLVGAFILLASYQWGLNPAPERLLFLLNVYILWFMLRILTGLFPHLAEFWQSTLMLLGGWQAFIGLRQLAGYEFSGHSLYNITGSFFNPGPYSGYLSLVVPICIYYIIHFRHYKQLSGFYYKIVHYLAYVCLFLIVIVLPPAMSRSAWIATFVSGLWVVWIELRWNNKLKQYWQQHKIKTLISSSVIFIALAGCLFFIFLIKKDSANGRLFLWKIDAYAWSMNKAGVGVGGFAGAYGKAQAHYFANHPYSEVEEFVAGSPGYAFNEYLQLLIEHSCWGLAIALSLIIYTLRAGIRNKQTGWTGALIAMLIFSYASYPLQLPVFVAVLVVIAIGCLTPRPAGMPGNESQQITQNSRLGLKTVALTLLIISSGISWKQRNMVKIYTEWGRAKFFYGTKSYAKAIGKYEAIYQELAHQPDFLFEYGQLLANSDNLHGAIKLFTRGTLLSCDPMFFNVLGRHYQELKAYDKAEACYLQSIAMLPGRIYPYYLLTKLYAEEEYRHEAKMYETAELLLNKAPKVDSKAVEQMKTEIREMLEDSVY